MKPFYVIQPAFTTGEISPAVASRVDLDKYKSALIKAENCIIRPYGGLYRRIGSKYIGACKYDDKDTVLVEFASDIDDAYMLEVGYRYIRIWKDGAYTGTEITTPFEYPKKLNFVQSADTMFICSGDNMVKTLKRDGTVFTLANFDLSNSYYDSTLTGASVDSFTTNYSTPGTYQYTVPITGEYIIYVAGAGGGGGSGAAEDTSGVAGGAGGNGQLITVNKSLTKGDAYTVVVGQGGQGGAYPGGSGTAGGTSSFDTSNALAGAGGTAAVDTSTPGTDGTGYANGGAGGAGGIKANGGMGGTDGFVQIVYDEDNTVTPSATTGNDVTVTSKKDLFVSGMIGGYIQLNQKMPSETVSGELYETTRTIYTNSIYVGESWKLNTSGTWHGNVTLQSSDDNVNWEDYRTYSSNDDQNFTESGSFTDTGVVTEGTYLRAVITMWNDDPEGRSRLHVDLTRLSYTHTGTAAINAVTDTTHAVVSIQNPFGSTKETKDYAFGPWCPAWGYPTCAGFFQDRLVLAANNNQPYGVWMSRTGDYNNFGVEKVSGTATDDSAIMMSLISRKSFKIKHIIPAQDLVILTTGNEWVVSGDSVAKPTSINPKAQTMHGSSDCTPQYIGNRIVYVQRRSGAVRDLGYTYESDNYNGIDLTILAKHLSTGHDFLSSAYAQEPDSVLYFVRDDGIICCLTIIREQDVYAWSRLTTDGKYEWVCSIPSGTKDIIYTIVKRGNKQYIESFDALDDDTDTFLDSYVTGGGKSIDTSHLTGKVEVMADGVDLGEYDAGHITLDTSYTRIMAGKKYITKIEQTGIEVELNDGTLQGRTGKINTVDLRVENTRGGYIGPSFDAMDEIPYKNEGLYTGDLFVNFPRMATGANNHLHVCLQTDRPYPFNLTAIIREVSEYGGFVQS